MAEAVEKKKRGGNAGDEDEQDEGVEDRVRLVRSDQTSVEENASREAGDAEEVTEKEGLS